MCLGKLLPTLESWMVTEQVREEGYEGDET